MNFVCEYCGTVFIDKNIDNCTNCGAPVKILPKERTKNFEDETFEEESLKIKPSTEENIITIEESDDFGIAIPIPRINDENTILAPISLRTRLIVFSASAILTFVMMILQRLNI